MTPYSIDTSEIKPVVDALLLDFSVKRAFKVLDPKTVISVCRRHTPSKRNRSADFVLKIGAPNYRETEFIQACKKAGEPFPVKKIQLRFYPKKKQ